MSGGLKADGIFLPFDFIEKYVRFAKAEYIQFYLYIMYCFDRDGVVPDCKEAARALGIPSERAEFIRDYWVSRNELAVNGGVTEFPAVKPNEAGVALTDRSKQKKNVVKSDVALKCRTKSKSEVSESSAKRRCTKPAYSQAEIEAAAGVNKQISAMFYQAETILNKPLTESETELLYSFNDWLGLPAEVITMLLSYAANKGKTTKRYLETVAIDWADKGIDTFEAAEAYISELEAGESAEAEVRKILGIHNRGLTPTERKYIKIWVNEMKIPSELISVAYDRTVEYTGKLSWSYMDKLLQSWVANGYMTEAEVKAADEEYYRTKGGKGGTKGSGTKNKFDNYVPETQTDYAELEEQILDMMLDEDFE